MVLHSSRESIVKRVSHILFWEVCPLHFLYFRALLFRNPKSVFRSDLDKYIMVHKSRENIEVLLEKYNTQAKGALCTHTVLRLFSYIQCFIESLCGLKILPYIGILASLFLFTFVYIYKDSPHVGSHNCNYPSSINRVDSLSAAFCPNMLSIAVCVCAVQ